MLSHEVALLVYLNGFRRSDEAHNLSIELLTSVKLREHQNRSTLQTHITEM